MPPKFCPRHGDRYPCTCAMGNLYRFVEPLVLLLLKHNGPCSGYDLVPRLQGHALTDAAIEKGAVYRVLRQLEANGNVRSQWKSGRAGPDRRIYRLTRLGEQHLAEWAAVLDHLSQSMRRFARDARAAQRRASSRAGSSPPRARPVLP